MNTDIFSAIVKNSLEVLFNITKFQDLDQSSPSQWTRPQLLLREEPETKVKDKSPDTLHAFVISLISVCAGLTACARTVSRESIVNWKLTSVRPVLARMKARATTDLAVMSVSVHVDIQVWYIASFIEC